MIGEVTFDALGGRWTMFMGTAAQCLLEEQHDKGFFAIVQDAMPDVTPAMLADQAAMADAARKVRVTALRELAWAALRKYHPDITIGGVCDIADDMGPRRFGEALGRAIAAAMDQAPPTEGEAGETAAKGKPRTRAKKRTGQS